MNFVNFLRDLLQKAELREETIDKILDKQFYREQFEAAFVHKSYDINAKKNYEKFEQLGDLVLNMAIVNYVVKKFPVIESAHWLSNIKHRLISGKSFAQIASDANFYPYIKMSDELKQDINKKIEIATEKNMNYINEVEEYRKILEDVFEAFVGTLQWIVDDYVSMEAGPGYAVAYSFIKKFLDKIEIPTHIEKIFDPISLVKEIYDHQRWPNKTSQMTKSTKNEETGMNTVIYIAPIKDKRVFLGRGESFDKTEARRKAAEKTLEILKNKYNIVPTVKSAMGT